MKSLIAETLEMWREAERILDDLPPVAPDYETVARLASELREMHSRLVSADDVSEGRLSAERQVAARARSALEHIRRQSGLASTATLTEEPSG